MCNSRPDTPDAVFLEIFLEQKPFARTGSDTERLLTGIGGRHGQVRIEEDENREPLRVTVNRIRVR